MDKKPQQDFETFPSIYNTLRLNKVVVYDSTLRDGEQMPGVAFTGEQKVRIARTLDEIGLPQIEAGFPIISKEERKTIKAITSLGLDAEILAISRVNIDDIDAVIDCDVDMILLFAATSDIHLRYKLRCGYQTVKDRSIEAIEYAKDHGIKVSFSSEDSTRTRKEPLLDILRTALELGVDRIGITDTVGGATPEAIYEMVGMIKGIAGSTPLSIHLHNDFGLGVANALAGVRAGARAVAVTVNGIGERAGNVPLEDFVMAMKVLYGTDLGIDTTGFHRLSRMVSEFSGVPIHRNKPFVGENAFCHESGIHVAALLRNPATYEVVPPEMVGNARHLRLGKHTGSTFVRKLLEEKSIYFTEKEVLRIVDRIKELPVVSFEGFWGIVREVLGPQN
ncbi:MAG: homoaconitate hydratase [Thermoplasmata archaeon]|nr:homoaconitate hydratase [Thermoplasmata archaeon]